jgi:uncharacterized protein (TIGR03435 family)
MGYDSMGKARVAKRVLIGLAVLGALGILTLSHAADAYPALAAAQAVTTPLVPMPANADPAFEVVTIKPSDTSAPHGTFFTTRGRHAIAYNISMTGLIAYAFGLQDKQIVGESSSILNSHFDIDGVPDIEGHPNLRQSRLMYQKLLQSRFRLTFHYETRELPAYAIVVSKDGPKLTKTSRQPSDGANFSYTNQIVLTVRNMTMADFAKGMQETFMERPVVDQTGLKDRYDFELKWTPDEPRSGVPPSSFSRDDPSAPPGLFTAIQEELGLKLVPTKAPIQLMVIDHIERPTEN